MIMAWLTNPGVKVGLDTLAKTYFKYEMKPFKEVVKKGEDFSAVSIEDAAFYAAEDAWMTYLLHGAIKKKMELNVLIDNRNVLGDGDCHDGNQRNFGVFFHDGFSLLVIIGF